MNIKKLGYFKEFNNPKRFVKPNKLIITQKLILKSYDMFTENPSDKRTIKNMEEFLIKEINNKNLSPRIGLGFTILSKDMLNVVRWDDKYPIVAVNNLYEFPKENRNIMEAKPLIVDDFGAYCIWELGIVNYEKNLWKEYLNSKRTKRDKIKYLYNSIEGNL